MIGEIENAMITRVQALSDSGALGYQFKQAATYAGQFDEDVKEVVRNFPLALISWTGEWAPPLDLGQTAWKYSPTFALIVAAKNLRNERATRHGAAGDVGTYQMLTDMRSAFVGQKLGLDILAMEPGPARSLFNRKISNDKMSVLVLELRTAFAVHPLDDGALDDFETFHADWDLPPFDGHTTVPVPAGDADATDDVTLETV